MILNILTGKLRNSVKSELLLLQQDQPFIASWKTGRPGWYWHTSVEKNITLLKVHTFVSQLGAIKSVQLKINNKNIFFKLHVTYNLLVG